MCFQVGRTPGSAASRGFTTCLVTDAVDPSKTVQIFKCDFCDFQSKWRRNIRRHLSFHTGEMFPCTVAGCRLSYHSATALRRHMTSAHNITRGSECTCVHCALAFQTGNELAAHLVKEHSLKETDWTFQCSRCSRVYTTLLSFHGHTGIHEREDALSTLPIQHTYMGNKL